MNARLSRSRPLKHWLLVCGLASLLAAAPGWACEEVDETASATTPPAETTVIETATEAPQAVAPYSAGLRVFIDPQTGEPVVPPPAKRRESPLAVDSLQFSDHGLRRVVLPDGSDLVRLEGRFQSMLVLQVGEDGQVKIGHQSSLPEDSASESQEEASNHE